MYTIHKTALYRDYELTGYLPPIDELLEWRAKIKELQANDGMFPAEWYDIEIQATDYLLDKHLK